MIDKNTTLDFISPKFQKHRGYTWGVQKWRFFLRFWVKSVHTFWDHFGRVYPDGLPGTLKKHVFTFAFHKKTLFYRFLHFLYAVWRTLLLIRSYFDRWKVQKRPKLRMFTCHEYVYATFRTPRFRDFEVSGSQTHDSTNMEGKIRALFLH